MPFTTNCHICLKKFKTGTALSKHVDFKHPQRSRQETVTFKDEDDRPVQPVKPAAIDSTQRGDYLKWLTALMERINASLIPDCPAKWTSIACFQVPAQYFAHMLYRLNNPWLDSVRETSHRRQPIFKKRTRRLSYKVYDKELFKAVIEEQDALAFKSTALFSNDVEVMDIADMDIEDAIAFAKQRARNKTPRPTSRSAVRIGMGEGRSTREVEFIWWPDLYSSCNYGKLAVRFYVHKTSL